MNAACRTANRARSGAIAIAFTLLLGVASLPGAAALLASATLLAVSPPAAAQASDPSPLRFQDGAEETRFRALVSQLRCVMCQNQSLADSNAQIAHDLRHEVLDLMREGRSDADIKRFLVARYGEFVLYQPRVESKTWLLWFGPALLLLAGGFVVAHVVRRHASAGPGADTRAQADDGQEW